MELDIKDNKILGEIELKLQDDLPEKDVDKIFKTLFENSKKILVLEKDMDKGAKIAQICCSASESKSVFRKLVSLMKKY